MGDEKDGESMVDASRAAARTEANRRRRRDEGVSGRTK